jgi:riboflavin kinase/FMN adenylyltransferase
MEVVAGIDRLTPAHGRLLVAIGVFDGLHRGHRYLLRHLRREAARRRARTAVVTFDHHPDEIILGAAPPLLCDPDERLVRLAAAGVDLVVVQHFDAVLRATPYDAFIRTIAARVDLAGFLMTPDAAFGHERRGTPATVAQLGATLGFEVAVVPPLDLDGRPVRSTEIRSALGRGDLVLARRLLGRAIEVVGDTREQPGEESGRVRFDVPVALPLAGSYRAGVRVEGSPAAASVPAVAVVDGDVVLVHSMRAPMPAGRVRVRFVAHRAEGGR